MKTRKIFNKNHLVKNRISPERGRKSEMGSGDPSRDRSRSAHRQNNNQPGKSNNIYQILPNDVTDNGISGAYNVNFNSRKKKFPPFTIFGMKINDFKDHLSQVNGIEMKNVHMKLTSQGIKVFVDSDSEFKTLHKFLVDNKYEFFSHTLNEERKQKVCLYGLYDMSDAQLKSDLNEVGVVPTEVKRIQIKKKRYSEHCIYLLYFMKRDNIKMTDLRKIKYVANCVVKWEFYSPKSKGPTQCSRCQNYGHGSDNCYLSPKCVRCGEKHDSNLCTYLPKIKDDKGTEVPDATKKIPLNHVRCANCRKNGHTANFKGCEARELYLKATNSNKNSRRAVSSKPVPQMNSFDHFPRLSKNATPMPSMSWVKPPINSNETNNDLFSAAECIEIMNELIAKLSKCQNKQSQMNVMFEVTCKYIYGSY